MRITVLWEDQRDAAAKGFGPGSLLNACIADDLRRPFKSIEQQIDSIPKKGNGNLLRALKLDSARLLTRGRLFAVFDHDKLHECVLDGAALRCKGNLLAGVKTRAPGPYDIILLFENMESIVHACCEALGEKPPLEKPTPAHRDKILHAVSRHHDHETRYSVRRMVASFDRLVMRVVDQMQHNP